MMKDLKNQFMKFEKKWKITKFFKAQRVHHDIDSFTKSMQNLMDILTFKVNVKNSEKLDKLAVAQTKILIGESIIEANQKYTMFRSDQMNDQLNVILEKITEIEMKQTEQFAQRNEYHCRFPGKPIPLNQEISGLTFCTEEEEKKTKPTDSEMEVPLSEGSGYNSGFDSDEIINNSTPTLTIKVVCSLDCNFDEGEQFQYHGIK